MQRIRPHLRFRWVPVLALFLGCAAFAATPGPQAEPGPAAPSFADLPPPRPPRKFDDAQIRAAGMRKLAGKHLTLYTDLGSNAAVDELPQIFDQAFPQWCAYFHCDPARLADWRINGFLMGEQERFRQSKLLPADLPKFLHGYEVDYEIWVNEQTTDYYRRHLLLHEGTHAFMRTQFNSCGPPWYMEGLAELLATHRWVDGKLTLGIMPDKKEDVPGWGRIKIVKDAFAKNQAHSLAQVLRFQPSQFLTTEPYGWSWAATAFFNGHPKYRDRFRDAVKDVDHRDFNARFQERFKTDWPLVTEEWQLFIATLEYGYDFDRAAIDFQIGKPLASAGGTATLRADRGWQASGFVVEAGRKYRLRASGRYQIAKLPKPWLSEANGVSLRYYRGHPLGLLLAAVHNDDAPPGAPSGLLQPIAVGLSQTIAPDRSGTLYFKINDSPAELSDNSGGLSVEIVPE
ncbi:MAG TPA: hypothetical protein VFE24_13475 [Pirellulales bacterium]|jgi:hypothetical protein|nr:hypothetical protein [Pirellulales bacterium]